MSKHPRSRPRKKHQSDSTLKLAPPAKKSSKVPLWQALLLPVTAIVLFFIMLEGGLALFGQKQALQEEDPFVGFASNSPLFVPSQGPGGRQVMTTAPNKKYFFNRQEFTQVKSPLTYRIFCLGGSTT